jgi:hypothetical protein
VENRYDAQQGGELQGVRAVDAAIKCSNARWQGRRGECSLGTRATERLTFTCPELVRRFAEEASAD